VARRRNARLVEGANAAGHLAGAANELLSLYRRDLFVNHPRMSTPCGAHVTRYPALGGPD
jgi:hypothetical protein